MNELTGAYLSHGVHLTDSRRIDVHLLPNFEVLDIDPPVGGIHEKMRGINANDLSGNTGFPDDCIIDDHRLVNAIPLAIDRIPQTITLPKPVRRDVLYDAVPLALNELEDFWASARALTPSARAKYSSPHRAQKYGVPIYVGCN